MGISIKEFSTAMEVYGATRLPNHIGSRYNVSVPCFEINGIMFFHSGSYYIVNRNREVPERILNKAMAELGEEHPGGSNFWWGEVHSVRGMLTLASMLENKYDKNQVYKMTCEVYRKLLSHPKIQKNFEFPYRDTMFSDKFSYMHKLVSEFDKKVNPFADSKLTMLSPEKYFSKVKVGIESFYDEFESVSLTLSSTLNSTCVSMNNSSTGVTYTLSFDVKYKGRNRLGYLVLSHYYAPEKRSEPDDEIIYLHYSPYNDYQAHPEDIDLRISLKSGLAWATYAMNFAHPVTDEELDRMIKYLKFCMGRIHRNINCYMTSE